MRKIYKGLSSVLLLSFLGASTSGYAEPVNKDLLVEGQQVIKAFATELKSTLQSAVKTGGLSAGISVCSSEAEKIANRYSQGAWSISRTSLKARNSKNVPDPWEAKTLADFERQLAAGASVSTLVASTHDGGAFRMMKAIPTQGMCLACHGQNLSKGVEKALLENYPHDKARGYKEGEIRGAFSLVFRGE